MKLNVFDRLSLGVSGLTAAFTLAVYPWLPERIPVHFDAHGVADGTLPRPLGAWFGVVFGVGIWLLMRAGHRVLPPDWRLRMQASPMPVVAFLMTVLFAAIQGVILYAALAAPPDVARVMGCALGGFWFLLGLVLPRVRRNPFVGIRTAHTLSSDENWARTHRLGGALFVAGGAIAIVGGLLGSLSVGVAAILTTGLVPVAYSYVLARRLGRV